MASDPREIHEAKRAVQKRFEGKPTEDLAMAAAVNSEVLLNAYGDHEDRISSLERFRIYFLGVVAALVLIGVPVLVSFLGGG